jgi:hypothetical protein
MVFCAHEVEEAKILDFTFYPTPSPSIVLPIACRSSAAVRFVNKDLDIAFATLQDRSIIDKYKLESVEWSRIHSENQNDVSRLFVGFPGESQGRLHAHYGIFNRFETIIETNLQKKFLCKDSHQAPTLPGMSGGGVFAQGKFVGICNTAPVVDDVELPSHATPSSAILEAYCNEFPDEAREYGLFELERGNINLNPVCRFTAKQYGNG